VPARTSSIAARSSAASRQQLQRERAFRVRKLVADLIGLGRGHFLELGLGSRIGDHPVEDVELGA
jgi:hypothetical protein